MSYRSLLKEYIDLAVGSQMLKKHSYKSIQNNKTIREFNENDQSSNFVVYFDMDGVLADFQGGASKNPTTAALEKQWRDLVADRPDIANMSELQFKELFSGKQKDPKIGELKKVYNKLKSAKYAAAAEEGFFENLDALPGAKDMLAKANELTGKKPNILTAPIESIADRAEKEKETWMNNNFPGMFNEFICTVDKAGNGRANSNSILIDDREKYINPWVAAGGIGILHKEPATSMMELEKIVKGQVSESVNIERRWQRLAGIIKG